ncbi:MAG: c-type cytochrome, partial [Rubripirellula sp.]
PQAISAADAANIAAHKQDELTSQLEELWGAVNTTPDQKRRLIDQYRTQLTNKRLANADQVRGQRVFQMVCGNCHKMFGQGKSIGPDLTGSNRDNLDYLLENIIDPSRIVPAELRQSAILLTDGRIINGTIMRQDENTLTVQTISEEILVPRNDVDTIRKLSKSLMPDGLLTQLTKQQVIDLFAYLKNATRRRATEPQATAPSRDPS